MLVLTAGRFTITFWRSLFRWLKLVDSLARSLTLEFSEDLLTDSRVKIVWVDNHLHREALELLQNRRDKSYSLCDAVSFLIIRERHISEALTTDRHFAQEGFHRLLK